MRPAVLSAAALAVSIVLAAGFLLLSDALSGSPQAIALVDRDFDGFSDTLEAHVGTDPIDACADNAQDAAWPPDVDNDKDVDGNDIAFFQTYYGQSVPPAPVRLDIAPEAQGDGFVDIFDIAAAANYYGQICTDRDRDGDGFSDNLELHVGTDPLVACGRDAWPADFNNDLRSDDLDRKRVQDNFGQTVPPAPVRYDIAPEPAGDNAIDIGDLARLSGLDGQACVLNPPPADSDGDGFSDIIENHIGTNPNVRCPSTSTPDDEPVDAWPPDYNDDGFADISDLSRISNWHGQDVPPAPVRFDIAPDPFYDNHVGDEDIREGQEYYGTACQP